VSKFSGLRAAKKGGEEASQPVTPQPSISATQNTATPEPKKLGRPRAKRSDTTNYTQVSGYIPKSTYLEVKKKMLAEEERDGQRREFSTILDKLLSAYARGEFVA